MLESLRTTLKAIQAMLNKCVKKVNGITPDADGNVQMGWQMIPDKPSIFFGTGEKSITEGEGTKASGDYSHAEGYETITSGMASHAEGSTTTANGSYSHAEGSYAKAIGYVSHAEGGSTKANGDYSHVEGRWTIASGKEQHVQGKFNIEDTANKYAHIVGNGTSDTERSNAHTLDWEGNAWFAGTVEGTALILTSSTGTKRFKITVDDTGTLTATEV